MNWIVGLGAYGKCRIWIGDLIGLGFQPDRLLARKLRPGLGCNLEATKEVAVEIYMPMGGKYHYGLLGGRFRPDSGDVVSVAIAVADEDKLQFDWALNSGIDPAFLGMPIEYGESVMDSIEERNSMRPLPPGAFEIGFAAHSHVGSSKRVFSALGAILFDLIWRCSDESPCDEMFEIIKEGIMEKGLAVRL